MFVCLFVNKNSKFNFHASNSYTGAIILRTRSVLNVVMNLTNIANAQNICVFTLWGLNGDFASFLGNKTSTIVGSSVYSCKWFLNDISYFKHINLVTIPYSKPLVSLVVESNT